MIPEMVGEILVYSLPIMTAGVTFVLTIGGVYLNNKYQNNKLVQALIILDQVVIDVVTELNQSVVEELKKARADGKLTTDEAEQIKCKAIDLVMKRIGVDMVKIIQKWIGPVLDIITTKIEATIFEHKKAKSLLNNSRIVQLKMAKLYRG